MKDVSIRSLLFVPADQERHIAKLHLRGADAIVLDLEDSVSQTSKSIARQLVRPAIEHLSGHGAEVWVRLDSSSTETLLSDIAACLCDGLAGVVIPKAEAPATLEMVDHLLLAAEFNAKRLGAPVRMIADIESARGIGAATALAKASQRLVALGLGEQDLSTDLHTQPTLEALQVSAQMIILAARASGLQAIGMPGDSSNFTNLELFEQTARQAKQIGFGGAACIHPRQVEILNKVFNPSDTELEWAESVRSAYQMGLANGKGAVSLEGRMIDEPIFKRAQTLLARASR